MKLKTNVFIQENAFEDVNHFAQASNRAESECGLFPYTCPSNSLRGHLEDLQMD